MANAINKRAMSFVISDHSKRLFYANGLTPERIKEQYRY
jgi:histidinol phosphatase-like PHP family hydrolase